MSPKNLEKPPRMQKRLTLPTALEVRPHAAGPGAAGFFTATRAKAAACKRPCGSQGSPGKRRQKLNVAAVAK